MDATREHPPEPATCALAYGPNGDGRCEWDGALLPDGRVRWCDDGCRAAFDDAHVWTRARRAALRRTASRCEVCGARPVQVHHLIPVDRDDGGYRRGCQHHASNLRVLCPAHHADDHVALRAPAGTQLALFRRAA